MPKKPTYLSRVLDVFNNSGADILSCAQIIVGVNNLDANPEDIKEGLYTDTLVFGISRAMKKGYIVQIPVNGVKTKFAGHNYQRTF